MIKFKSLNQSKDFLKILTNSTSDQSISSFYLIWGDKGRGKSYVMQGLHRKYIEGGKTTFHFSFKDRRVNSPEILMDLASLEALFIEDFELMEDSEDWEKAIFNLINDIESYPNFYIFPI